MGIPVSVIPDDSMYFRWAFEVACHIVNQQIRRADPLIYQLCVYNLAGSNLLNYAQDAPDAPVYGKTGLPYFAAVRSEWKLTSFVPGVISSVGDEATSASYATPEQLKTLTLQDLQNLKDPYGRAYLGYAQAVGTLWGLS